MESPFCHRMPSKPLCGKAHRYFHIPNLRTCGHFRRQICPQNSRFMWVSDRQARRDNATYCSLTASLTGATELLSTCSAGKSFPLLGFSKVLRISLLRKSSGVSHKPLHNLGLLYFMNCSSVAIKWTKSRACWVL